MSSWGLGWKRPLDIFKLTLSYGTEEAGYDPFDRLSTSSSSSSLPTVLTRDPELGFRIDLQWTSGEEEDQVALKLQSQLMVSLPMPQDSVVVELAGEEEGDVGDCAANVGVEMRMVKRREPLRAVVLTKGAGSGQLNDGVTVLTLLMRSDLVTNGPGNGLESGFSDHWTTVTAVSLCGLGLSALPVDLIRLPVLEKLYFDNNRLSTLPPELGAMKNLKVLSVDNNMLVSVPVELRECVGLLELSLEHNRLVRPLLDFRAMAELKILRLFGNPLEFLPEILPLHKLRHLSLANIRIVADENLRSVNVQIEMENSSYFGASRHKLSAFFSLIFRFSSCHHLLLASTLAKIMQDEENRAVVGKDENAVRQLISMISSENRHVVEQACSALSSLSVDVSVAMLLMKCDIMRPIIAVLKSFATEEVISVLQVVGQLALASDTVAQKMLTKDVLKSLKLLCAHKSPEVQRFALLAVGNLAFCLENRRVLVTSESLQDLLMRLTAGPEPRVNKAAARALAILGENESLRRAIRGRQVPKQGLRILSMDGGGMKGLATVQILKEIEKGTGKRIHELFDLICGTSTGGMLAIALAVKLMTLDQCEEIYKNLGKLVFAEPFPKDNEAATWREKLDQIYKSSSQSFRVVVHGSKHSADQFERLLKEMCADEDGDLLIESAVKNVPKVFTVSTLVSVMPAQPFIFRNYQERNVLKVFSHYPKLELWRFRSNQTRMKTYIENSGLAPLLQGGQPAINPRLISAFCERWHPETNTFHLPIGEMTITLDDISCLLHIPIGGTAVTLERINRSDGIDIVRQLLGINQQAVEAEFNHNKGPNLRLSFLRNTYMIVDDSYIEQAIECATRAYLLHLVGCTIFADKSGASVPVIYLTLFADLTRIHEYAWGAAALAYTYRQLGIASRFRVTAIAGYMTILQYPAGTSEVPFSMAESYGITVLGSPTTGAQVGYKRSAFIGSCKHQIWQAIRASSAAPYYLDDFSDDVFRWQDGAIVANNPTIFAIREAQLLWPDTRIDCLVSIGCGSVPIKTRRGGWRYLDTGQVLIESACSVDRVEEALSTLLPMLPEIQYFRFNPVDERCEMELDETDPAEWLKLEASVDEYIHKNSESFKNVCVRLLLPFQQDGKWSETLKSQHSLCGKVSNADEISPSLGWRRNVLLVEAMHSPDSGRVGHHARALESFCARNGIRFSLLHGISEIWKSMPGSKFPTPFTSPYITGSFPPSPLLYSPNVGPQKIGRIDMVPPLSLDGLQAGKTFSSPPVSPKAHRQLSLHVRSLHEKLQSLPQVGIVHLALQNDAFGSILSWQNDVFVVAEPGELADKFLQSVKSSLLSVMRSNRRKGVPVLSNISTIADLVHFRPYFQVGNVVHRYIGCQTRVMEDDHEIAAYMFRRTVPSMHLTPDDVRWMIGVWRERIIICTGTYGPTPTLVKAFLDSGAKAVICPSARPREMSLTSFHVSGEFNVLENGRFEIGEEEAEDEDIEHSSPVSDWEDSEPEKSGGRLMGVWDDDEEDLSQFICHFYEFLFREGGRVDVALQKALASHRKLRYICHLPGIQ